MKVYAPFMLYTLTHNWNICILPILHLMSEVFGDGLHRKVKIKQESKSNSKSNGIFANNRQGKWIIFLN